MENNSKFGQGILRMGLLLASSIVLSEFVVQQVQAEEVVSESHIVESKTEAGATTSNSQEFAVSDLVEESASEAISLSADQPQADEGIKESTAADSDKEKTATDSAITEDKIDLEKNSDESVVEKELQDTEKQDSVLDKVANDGSSSVESSESSATTDQTEGPLVSSKESSEKSVTNEIESQTQTAPVQARVMSAKQSSTETNRSRAKANVSRIQGRNRYINATEISKAGWTQSDKVILTNGTTFADSLTGSSLAGKYDAPILFTRSDRIYSETIDEIKRLNAKEVVVLGGEKSVPTAILDQIRAQGVQIRRIDGNNRYNLAGNIAKEVKNDVATKYDAFLASGEIASDALSIAPVASSKRSPIYLTRNNRLEQAVIDAIPFVNQWTVIGSNKTISDSVVNQMIALGAKIRRIGGNNRYEVNRNIIDYYVNTDKTDKMYVVSGEHFSDAIPSAVLAAKEGTGVLLVKNNNDNTNRKQKDFARRDKNIDNFVVIGGTATISKTTAEKLENTYIFLDPGHGGYESGAYYNGVAEKDINLQVTNKVNALLKSAGYKVLQSRTSDKAVGLYDRPDMANKRYNDIFISIHHNAMPGATGYQVSGIETYYYEHTPGEPYQPLNDNYYTYLEAIDSDRRDHSIELATSIHNEAVKATGAINRGVRENDFVVNRETTMPSVLLELGYMSNPVELKKLTTNTYQNMLSNAIFKGIERYFS